MRKTKIVATLGPSSNDVEQLKALIEAGIGAARLNFSHGDHEEHGARINNFKQAREELGKPVPIVLDTKGPEIRIKTFATKKVSLVAGQEFTLTTDDIEGDNTKVAVTYMDLPNDVKIGSTVLIDDGLVGLTVVDIKGSDVICTVNNSAELGSRKGVNLPDIHINLPALTEKDIDDIKFGVEMGIDYIAASFIRSAKDVLEIKRVLEECGGSDVHIISKIENRDGVDNIDEILEVTDGIMVARGDLGVEIPTEDVPIVQKQIIKKCNQAGKPVITATQMLDSMQRNPRPTRAEAGDVANAIFDGTDAVMLSGETAAGDYPVEAVKTMASICSRTEDALVGQDAFTLKAYDNDDLTEAIGQSVGHTARNLGIKTIVAATSSGHTANMIAKYRPQAHILAATFDEKSARTLALTWGVEPYVIEKPGSTDEMLDSATALSQEKGYAKEGDLIIITAGVPVGESGTTNIMKIQLIGTQLVKGQGVGSGNFIGKAVLAEDAKTANEQAVVGSVLVVKSTDKDYTPAIEKAGAIIVEQGGITSHAAVIGLEKGIPVIVNAGDALNRIKNNELITVDARRGVVYRGATISI